MLDILRSHGLVVFILAFAVVSFVRGAVELAAGRHEGSLGVAVLLGAILIEEMQRRELARRARALDVVRWICVLGALGWMMA